MKFVITYKEGNGWRWNLSANNGKVICSGEAYQRPQKMINTINRYIVRGDPVLAQALAYELSLWSLTPTGTQMKGQ